MDKHIFEYDMNNKYFYLKTLEQLFDIFNIKKLKRIFNLQNQRKVIL